MGEDNGLLEFQQRLLECVLLEMMFHCFPGCWISILGVQGCLAEPAVDYIFLQKVHAGRGEHLSRKEEQLGAFFTRVFLVCNWFIAELPLSLLCENIFRLGLFGWSPPVLLKLLCPTFSQLEKKKRNMGRAHSCCTQKINSCVSLNRWEPQTAHSTGGVYWQFEKYDMLPQLCGHFQTGHYISDSTTPSRS